MSGNGKASIMRPAGRSPPFVIVGLLIVLCALGFKYWSLLGQQGDLSRQCEEVRVELRSVYEKQMTAEKTVADMTAQLNAEKQRRESVQKTVEEKDKKVAEQQGEIERLNKEVEAKKQESAQCDKERGDVRAEKEKLAAENQKLKEDVTKLQSSPQCDRNACKDPIRELVGALGKTLGQGPLSQALSKVPFDLNPILGDMMQSAGNKKPGDEGAGGQQQKPAQVVDQLANNIHMAPPAGGRGTLMGGLLNQGVESGVGGAGNLRMSKQQQDAAAVPNHNHGMVPNHNGNGNVEVMHEDGGQPDPGLPRAGDVQVIGNKEAVDKEEEQKQADLPEDDMDRQAAAIHKAQEEAGIEDSRLNEQLEDMSQNGANEQVNVAADYEAQHRQHRMDAFNEQRAERHSPEKSREDHLDGSDTRGGQDHVEVFTLHLSYTSQQQS